MARHSKYEQERRAAESARMKEIETAWMGSLPKPAAADFVAAVAAARNRPPQEPPQNMAPAPGRTRPSASHARPRRSETDAATELTGCAGGLELGRRSLRQPAIWNGASRHVEGPAGLPE